MILITLPKDNLVLIIQRCEFLLSNPCKIFDTKGITKDACLQMCIEHDKIASKGKGKHPYIISVL